MFDAVFPSFICLARFALGWESIRLRGIFASDATFQEDFGRLRESLNIA